MAANSLPFDYQTGKTLYGIVTDPVSGNYWNATTPAFEAYNAAHWTNYAVALTEVTSSGKYTFPFPTGITQRGRYHVDVRLQASGSPVLADRGVGGGDIGWTGAAITSLESMPVFTGHDFTDAIQKIFASAAGPVSGAGSGHVDFKDPASNLVFECDTDNLGNRSNFTYH